MPETKVRIRKLIRDLRDQYPYGAVLAMLIETIGNSIDAHANEIRIEIDRKNYRFRAVDNGIGMKEDEFIEYHNIAAQTKTRGVGIGFAGVGAKIFLDLAHSIYTETTSPGKFSGASKWQFKGEIPNWDRVEPVGLVDTHGTGVEVHYFAQYDEDFDAPILKKAILEHYNYALSPYGNLEIWLDGIPVAPFQFEGPQVKAVEKCSFRIKNQPVSGTFALMHEPLPEYLQGIAIVVKGKTICRWNFAQVVLDPDRVGGYLRADHLISGVTTSKTDFNRTTPDWRGFVIRAGRAFSEWLSKVGEKPRARSLSDQLEDVRETLEEELNQLFRMDEIQELLIDPLQSIIRRTTALNNPEGEQRGVLVEGVQLTAGVLGNENNGNGVAAIGNEPGQALLEKSEGRDPVTSANRRLKGGIRLGYANGLGDVRDAWLDLSIPAIIINTAHPAFIASIQMTAEPFHFLRAVFDVLTEGKDEQARTQLRHRLFEGWVKVQER